MNEDMKLPNFDPDFCFRVTRRAAACCFGLLVVELILLIAINVDSDSCALWTIHRTDPTESKEWPIILFALFGTGWICFVAIRWQQVVQRLLDEVRDRPYPGALIDYNLLFPVITIGWTLFCSIPLWRMLFVCPVLFRRLGF